MSARTTCRCAMSLAVFLGMGGPGARHAWAVTTQAVSEVLKVEAPAEGVYTLGEGDEITVEAVGRLELSGKHVVGPDGRITIPVSGPVKVSGLTREQAAKAVMDAWAGFYSNIRAVVRVDKYASNRILIIGRVANPGVFYFDRSPTLLEALTRGGLITPSAVPGSPATAERIPARCGIFRGKDQVIWVQLATLLENGNPAIDMQLQRNDVVYVPADRDQFVSVLGEVQHPGAFRLTPDLSLVDLFAMAGGLTELASPKNIKLVRAGTTMVREISLDEILTSGELRELKLQPEDILYVPRSGFAKFSYVLQRLNPMSTLLYFAGTTKR